MMIQKQVKRNRDNSDDSDSESDSDSPNLANNIKRKTLQVKGSTGPNVVNLQNEGFRTDKLQKLDVENDSDTGETSDEAAVENIPEAEKLRLDDKKAKAKFNKPFTGSKT